MQNFKRLFRAFRSFKAASEIKPEGMDNSYCESKNILPQPGRISFADNKRFGFIFKINQQTGIVPFPHLFYLLNIYNS